VQGFDTSQGKKHEDAGAIKIKSTRGARQYMNRRVRAGCLARVLAEGPALLPAAMLLCLPAKTMPAVRPRASHCNSWQAFPQLRLCPPRNRASQGGFNRSLDGEGTGEKVRIEWLRS